MLPVSRTCALRLCFITFYFPFHLLCSPYFAPLALVTQIRGHLAGTPPPSPARRVPSFFFFYHEKSSQPLSNSRHLFQSRKETRVRQASQLLLPPPTRVEWCIQTLGTSRANFCTNDKGPLRGSRTLEIGRSTWYSRTYDRLIDVRD